jgi:hypothetical protein
VELRPLEHRPNDRDRIAQLAVGALVDGGRSSGRQREAQQRAQRGRLPGTVRAEEAKYPAGGGAEAQSVDGERGPERFVSSLMASTRAS